MGLCQGGQAHGVTRIVIFHRNRLHREGLALILDRQPAMLVVGSAVGWAQLGEELRALHPDVVLLDFGLPGRTGLSDSQRVRQLVPGARVLLMGVPDLESDVLACFEIGGASGYLLQEASAEDLVNNVNIVASGGTLCSPKIARLAFSRLSALAADSKTQGAELMRLTQREREIIAFIEGGLSNKEIAGRLHIEVQTVKNHVHNILDKLRLDGRREAAQYARERGLVIDIRPGSDQILHSKQSA